MKKWMLSLCMALGVLTVLPLLAVWLVPADAGMAAIFLMFFAIDPIFFVAIGVFASKEWRRDWLLLFVSAFIFWFSAWLILDRKSIVFLLYATVYVVLGLGSMALTVFFKHFSRK